MVKKHDRSPVDPVDPDGSPSAPRDTAPHQGDGRRPVDFGQDALEEAACEAPAFGGCLGGSGEPHSWMTGWCFCWGTSFEMDDD